MRKSADEEIIHLLYDEIVKEKQRETEPIIKKQIRKQIQEVRRIIGGSQPEVYDPFITKKEWRDLGVLSIIVIILLQIINILV